MMTIDGWMITSWVAVGLLTGINVFVFIKLKGASEKMLKMAFPGAKNMHEALAGMQNMMNAAKKGNRGRNVAQQMSGMNNDAQLRAAQKLLKQMQGGKRK